MIARLKFAAPLMLAVTLAGCAQQPRPAASVNRVYAVDLAGGAQVCTVPRSVDLVAGQPTDATMVVGNDGGWCGIAVSQPGPRPFAAGLVTTRPQHGRLHIRRVGDYTRVDYIPNAGYRGADAFAVRLMPGGAVLRVAATVN
jgi:hypothetical protein